jgi:lipid-binding SYLF domain-containing protein
MNRRTARHLLLTAVIICTTSGLSTGTKADITSETNALIEAARTTVKSFVNGPDRTQFRATVSRAYAIIVLPASRLDRSPSRGSNRGAVVVVHDQAKDAWSNPAFYRVFVAADEALTRSGGIVFTVMKPDAVRQLKVGKMVLGGTHGFTVVSVNTGIEPEVRSTATTEILAFVEVDEGFVGPSSFDGWKLTADNARNKNYYDDGATPETILSEHTVRDPGDDALIGNLHITPDTDTLQQ